MVWLTLLIGAAGPWSTAAALAEPVALVMLEDPGCPYCARWDREVGGKYASSAEGQFAPLSRHRRGDPAVAHITDVRYSPTFVVMRGRREVGRIVGYPGEDFFWAQLGDLLRQAGFRE